MEKNNEDLPDTIAIALLKNDRAEGIVIFCLANKSNARINESSNIANEVVPVTIGIKRKYDYQAVYKITALMKGQLELVHWNSPTPIALQDLQWSRRPKEESYRQQFLETFSRYNEISALRGLENYYAAKTSRYTIIQNHLLSCIGITRKKPKHLPNEDQSWKFSSPKESQSYRIILDDGTSNTTTERRNAIEDQSEYKKNVVHQNSMLSEMESLKKENELLGLALRKAADLHISMVSVAEENLKEKNKLVEERRAFEEHNNDLLAKNEELRKLASQADKLRMKKRKLEKTRRVLEEDKEKFFARKDVFERFNETQSCALRENVELLEEQRRSVEEERQDVLAQKKELLRLQSNTQTEASSLRVKERSLKNARRDLEQERKQFLADKKKFERSNEVAVNSVLDKEKSLKEQREQIQCAQRNLAENRNAFQNCQNQVSQQQEELNAETNRLRETQRSIDAQREDLRNLQRNLLEQQAEFEEYCETNTNRLKETQEEIEKQRQRLEIQKRELIERREENIRQAATTTPLNRISNDQNHIEIPIIPLILSWKINLPFSR